MENALPAMTDREPTNPDQSLQQTSERSPSAVEICNLPDGGQESTATRNDRIRRRRWFFTELSFTRQRFTALRLIWTAPSRSSLCTGHGLRMEQMQESTSHMASRRVEYVFSFLTALVGSGSRLHWSTVALLFIFGLQRL